MICCRGLWRLSKVFVLVIVSGLLMASLASAEEITSGLGHSVARVSPGGVAVYRPERWGQINVQLLNPTDDPQELLVTTFIQDEPALQYGRRCWIPPRSRLQTWHPLRIPQSVTGNKVDIRTLVMDARQEREVLLRGDGGQLQLDGVLRVSDDAILTGMLEPPAHDSPEFTLFPDENVGASPELVVVSRLEAQHTRRLSFLIDQFLPTNEECFQTLDQLVIADSRVALDDAGLAATRSWLFGGGRLWVMLDQVDPRVLERLLGDEFACEIIDRVGLTTVRLEAAQAGKKIQLTHDYEQPVDFVRVAVSDVDVAYTVDGWPAAFWKNCGEGRLLVTTLGPRGWMRHRTAADTRPLQNRGQARPGGEFPPAVVANELDALREPTGNAALEPMANMALEFFSPRLPRLLPDTLLAPLTQAYVGYSIPSRAVVLGLLLGFTSLLMSLGTWLRGRGRLELLGAIGPGIALGISVILVLVGRHQRGAVPPTVAQLQFAQAIPGTDDVRISGVAGLYAPDTGSAKISAHEGGWVFPDPSGFEATTRRMVWTDLDAWQWEHLPQTAGIRNATFESTTEHPERLEAHATFGPEGLTGRLQIPEGYRATDPLLATRDGRFGVELRDDGTFTARAENVLATDQFLAAGLLSDEQGRRRQLLQKLLTNPLRRDFPEMPYLFLWTEPWDIGFQLGENRRSLGSALLAVPLKLQRPEAGTGIRIASPFLTYRGVIGPDESPPTGWWDFPRRQWIEKSQPAETWLRFQIPNVLLPISAERGRVTMQVKGPMGKLTLAGHRPSTNAIVPLKTWIDPVGTLSLDITDPELLSVSADGGLLLRISAGDPDRPELTQLEPSNNSIMSYWQLESLSLELHAKTIDSSNAIVPQP